MDTATDHQGRILLVDDESAILRTFRYCLEDEAIPLPPQTARPRLKPCFSARYSTFVFWTYGSVKTTAWMSWRKCAFRHRGCAW